MRRIIVCKRCKVVHTHRKRNDAPAKCSNCGLKEAKADQTGITTDWYEEVNKL
jgi:hypothetical protein